MLLLRGALDIKPLKRLPSQLGAAVLRTVTLALITLHRPRTYFLYQGQYESLDQVASSCKPYTML